MDTFAAIEQRCGNDLIVTLTLVGGDAGDVARNDMARLKACGRKTVGTRPGESRCRRRTKPEKAG